jgi:hypothetical protein
MHHTLLSTYQWDSRDIAKASGNQYQSVLHVPASQSEYSYAPHKNSLPDHEDSFLDPEEG